jgi:hypothetical protein
LAGRGGVFFLPAPPTRSDLPPDPDLRPKFVCAYDYVDENGALLYQVVRFEPKAFKQRRPGAKHGTWIWGLNGVRRVLYRLPDLIEAVAGGCGVLVVEGEKDCDHLAALGLVATTCSGGATKWCAEYSETLRRAHVIIIPDNDAAGRRHADQVGAALTGIAESVSILDLPKVWPECPEKGDVSDWIAATGITADALWEEVQKAPAWKPASTDVEPRQPTASTTDVGWPVMDPAALHGLAGEVVRTIEPDTEADPNAILIHFLVFFGSVVGNGPYFLIEADRHHTNLFTVLVGRSAKGRKGTAGNRVLSVFSDQAWLQNCVKSGLSSGEGLINEVRDKVEKWDVEEHCMRVVDPGVTDKRRLILETEFANALAVMDRPGNTLSPVIRNAWDGKKLSTLTKNSPLTATGAHISTVAHITEHELRSGLTKTNAANGFANRFLFACVRRSKLLPHGGHLAEVEIVRLSDKVTKAIEAARDVGRVTMTDAAAQKWEKVYKDLSADQPGLLGAVTARGEAQVIRLALIYALLDTNSVVSDVSVVPAIDVPHLEAAIAVWDYCDASAALIFGDRTGDPTADEILQALKHAGSTGMTRTAIRDHFGRNRSGGRISEVLALLAANGLARMETRGTAGRSAEVWIAIEEAV